jgi:hypothetical protein
MEAAAAYSHRADKVSDIVPFVPTIAYALHMDALSHAAVFLFFAVWVRVGVHVDGSILAVSAVLSTPRSRETDITFATDAIVSDATLSLLLQQPLRLLLPLRPYPCSAVQQAASTS